MVTTAVVAEIVVAGLQAATWLTLLVLAIFGVDWVHPSDVSDWTALITLLVIAAAYMLGVIADRLADNLVLRPLNRIRAPRPVDKPAAIEEMRLAVLAEGDGVARFLDYQRSRMRVARSTLLNLLLLAPALAAFLLAQTDAGAGIVIGAVLVVLAAALVTGAVQRDIEFAYLSRLGEVYARDHGIPRTDIAAAVCCCRRDGRLEFRLVSTKDGARWTFPKGHRHGGETLPEAALREAREEAGVDGGIDGARLATYRYPASRPGKRDDDVVAAYLLEVHRIGEPTEPGRKQAWCDFEEARAKLAEGRESRYAEEMEHALLAGAERAELAGRRFGACPAEAAG